jgi:hypothetical protein
VALADDLDRGTESTRDLAAQHTRGHLDPGGTESHESNRDEVVVVASRVGAHDETERVVPIAVLTPGA